jgi:5'-nucleotidase (lipoprotein e(P4) family)
MSKTHFILTAAVFIGLLAACKTETSPEAKQVEKATANQSYIGAATLFMQSSAEHKALCYQAYNLAKWRLDQYLADNPQNPAVITDLDETVLDNSAYSGWQLDSDQPYGKDTWAKWVELEEATLVAGAKEFLDYADQLGVKIFYVSNRLEGSLDVTMSNMKALELPQVEAGNFYLKSETSNKTARRQAIYDQDYQVLLYLGDNLADFSEIWERGNPSERAEKAARSQQDFGSRFIVFPNPVYGTWEGSIYDFNWSLNPEQRDSARMSQLNVAVIE